MTPRRTTALAAGAALTLLAGTALLVMQGDELVFRDGFEQASVRSWSDAEGETLVLWLASWPPTPLKDGSRTSWLNSFGSIISRQWHPGQPGSPSNREPRWGDPDPHGPYAFRTDNAGPHGFLANEARDVAMRCLRIARGDYDVDGLDFAYVDNASLSVERAACAAGCNGLGYYEAKYHTTCNQPQPAATPGGGQ